jgi:hypothetical protein
MRIVELTCGNTASLAICSSVSHVFDSINHKALGSFQIAVAGRFFGLPDAEASMLGCSVDEVSRRIANKGRHTAFYSSTATASAIAKTIAAAIYGDDNAQDIFFGMARRNFLDSVYESYLIWAPDGDQAFDDSSVVLHFDVGDKVRIIAFHNEVNGIGNLEEVWLSSDYFYRVLVSWRDAFVVAIQGWESSGRGAFPDEPV